MMPLPWNLVADPGGTVARTAARLLQWIGLPHLAQAVLRRRVETRPFDVFSLARLGDLYAAEAKWEAARQSFDQATRRAPHYASAWVSLGISLHELRRIDDAIRTLEQATELDPTNQEAHFRLAASYMRARRFQDALMSARRASALDGSDVLAAGQIGQILTLMEHYEEALPWLRRAAASCPHPPHSYNLGIVLLQLRQLEEAQQVLHTAVALEPTSLRPKLPLAEVLCRRDRFDDAIDLLKDQLTTSSPDADALNVIIEANRLDERYDEAIRVARLAIRHHPSSAAARCSLARVLLSSGDAAAAASEYLAARKLEPARVDCIFGLAATLSVLGQEEQACRLFAEALAIESSYFERDPELAKYQPREGQVGAVD